MGLFNKISDGLKKSRNSMTAALSSLFSGHVHVDDEMLEELEEILIMADVGAKTAGEILDKLRKAIKQKGTESVDEVQPLLRSIISEMVSGGDPLNISTKPSVVLVIGVNGVGKTTTIGKLAYSLRQSGKSVLLGAADTFRAAAIDQLQIWADRAGVNMIRHEEGSDPAAVVFDTIVAGKARNSDVIICDTAGRLHNKKGLMEELTKISRIITRELPDSAVEVLLVLDATTGQNALQQAREFSAAAGITGLVLTKLDGTAKGGVIIAIRNELNVPVKYIGVGEQIDDLQTFEAEQFVSALFDVK